MIAKGIIPVLFAMLAQTSYGQVAVPHAFQPGTTINSGEVNANFNALASAHNSVATMNVTSADFVGSWICTSIYDNDTGSNPVGYQILAGVPVAVLTGAPLEFIDNGDGTYSLSNGAPNPITPANNFPQTRNFIALNGVIFLGFGGFGNLRGSIRLFDGSHFVIEFPIIVLDCTR